MVVRTTWNISEGLISRKERTRLTIVLGSATTIDGYVSAEDVLCILCERVRLYNQLSLSGSNVI